MTVYLNGQFLPKDQARISPDDRAFLFADGAYEVVRAYRGHLFRAKEHWDRFDYSLRALRIPAPANTDFSAIANRRGTTELSLKTFLRSDHKTMPNFIIEPYDADVLVAYILSLRRR